MAASELMIGREINCYRQRICTLPGMGRAGKLSFSLRRSAITPGHCSNEKELQRVLFSPKGVRPSKIVLPTLDKLASLCGRPSPPHKLLGRFVPIDKHMRLSALTAAEAIFPCAHVRVDTLIVASTGRRLIELVTEKTPKSLKGWSRRQNCAAPLRYSRRSFSQGVSAPWRGIRARRAEPASLS
jgi:hypothetical protein